MIYCRRCGTEWEDFAPSKWDADMQSRFSEGGGCQECVALDDTQAAEKLQHAMAGRTESQLRTTLGLASPAIANALTVVGMLAILGGITLCIRNWPGDAGQGSSWRTEEYTPALTWLFYGVFSGIASFAGAAALTYLHQTRAYMRGIYIKLVGVDKESEQVDLPGDRQ